MWWGLFGVSFFAWLATLVAVYSGWTPPHLFFAGMATGGLALSVTFHHFGIRRIWRNRPRGADPNPEAPA